MDSAITVLIIVSGIESIAVMWAILATGIMISNIIKGLPGWKDPNETDEDEEKVEEEKDKKTE